MISIIIPVYNSERYLHDFLSKLLSIPCDAAEFIFVNDGSTDRSLEILESYVDKRLHIINIENRGVSGARNTGLVVAKGDYIGFADPDDLPDPKMYLKMLETAAIERADIVVCNYACISEKGMEIKEESIHTAGSIFRLSSENAVAEMFKIGGTGLFMGHVWSKLFKREIIGECRFNESIACYEDLLFSTEIFLKANSVVFFPEKLYGYRIHSDSIMSRNYSEKQFTALEAIQMSKELLKGNFYLEMLCDKFYVNTIINQATWACKTLSRYSCDLYFPKFKRELWKNKNTLIKCKKKQFLKGLLILISPNCYYVLSNFKQEV